MYVHCTPSPAYSRPNIDDCRHRFNSLSLCSDTQERHVQSWDPDLNSNNDDMPPQSTDLSSKYRLLTLPHAFFDSPATISDTDSSLLKYRYIPSLRPLYLYSAAHELAKEQRKNFGEDITCAIRYAKKKVFMSSIIYMYLVTCGLLVF